ncbi:peptidylprolyl isomerase [Shouchella miscanthi]|uniref:peptidylprolyl isomerase n=1 Tax=Shouchella miscanthi TaxID=2598861 RepID=UPI00399D6FB4
MKELKYGWLIVLSLLVFAACGTSEGENVDDDAQTAGASNETATEGVPEVPVEADDTPIATIEMEDGGEITVELYPEIAPISVNNFVALAEDGFYDGLRFHRIIEGFMIQGGDPNGNGSGGPGYSIKGEFESNGVENDLSHEPGVLSMARSQGMDTAGSQFFIVHGDATYLDGDYAAFGKVIDGMDIVDQIATVDKQGESPVAGQEQVIQSIVIER